jgi:hypothetical protein
VLARSTQLLSFISNTTTLSLILSTD